MKMLARQIILLLFGCLAFFAPQAQPIGQSQTAGQPALKPQEDRWTRSGIWVYWLFIQIRENYARHESWMKRDLDTCPGINKNDDYFVKKGDKELSHLPLVEWKTSYHSEGIYNITSETFSLTGDKNMHKSSDYIVKLVDVSPPDGHFSSCEPHALQQLGIWHRTGIRESKYGELLGAILMKRERGEMIEDNELWQKASQKEQKAVLDSIKEKARGKHHKLAFETRTNVDHILPSDFQKANFLVHIVQGHEGIELEDVALIDLGYPGNTAKWLKHKGIDDPEYIAWFNRLFDLFWAGYYKTAGDARIYEEYQAWRKHQKTRALNALLLPLRKAPLKWFLPKYNYDASDPSAGPFLDD
ncbi:hypothetical protein C8R42DRAFT_667312 [Lentinula raphanica]|nr:hypothetical protein C8R42DRAFT_667312 [Lentinula raphanica]